ncbi:MAG: hypothetical protein QOC57_2008, partial [Ilumatobacteraceae bacterium]
MTTDLLHSSVAPRRLTRTRAPRTLAFGTLGGCTLGIAARGWMRLLADEPAFTWSGTIFIVAGFTTFGLTRSIVVIAHRTRRRGAGLTIARVFGVVGILPLFVAAGGVMMPTVVGAGLASARTEWRSATRWICLAVAALPVLLVGKGLVDSFGWSLHAVVGFVVMLAVYATIVRAAWPTFSAR